MIKVVYIPNEGQLIRASAGKLADEAIKKMLDLAAQGMDNMSRLLVGAGTFPVPVDITTATEEVVMATNEIFGGPSILPSDRIEVELIDDNQRQREGFDSSMKSHGVAATIDSVIIPELGKAYAGVRELGLTTPRVVDGEWRYVVQIYTDHPTAIPKKDYQRRISHEFGHVVHDENGAVGANVFDFKKVEGDIGTLWSEICKMASRHPKNAPLTVQALSYQQAAFLPTFVDGVERNRDYYVKIGQIRDAIMLRERMEPQYKERMKNSKMLREGFAEWFSSIVMMELGHEADQDYTPTCAIDTPYKSGKALFDSMPLPKAFEVGMISKTNSDLERAAAPHYNVGQSAVSRAIGALARYGKPR